MSAGDNPHKDLAKEAIEALRSRESVSRTDDELRLLIRAGMDYIFTTVKYQAMDSYTALDWLIDTCGERADRIFRELVRERWPNHAEFI